MSRAKRIVVRAVSDGKFLRMHPGGFGARFPSGPYLRVDDAFAAPMNLYEAQKYSGYAVQEDLGGDGFAYYVPEPPAPKRIMAK